MLKANIGKVDKSIRLLAAIVLLFLVVTKTATGLPALLLTILALALVLTSFLGFCPIWHLLKIRTLKQKPEKERFEDLVDAAILEGIQYEEIN